MSRTAARGFTLLELLIAVAVLAIVLTIIYRSYWVCTKNVAQAQEHSDLYQSARLALRRLSDDLMCAYVPVETGEGGEKAPEAAPPGEEGAEAAAPEAATGFRAFDGGSGEAARDVLEFVSLANLSRKLAAQLEPCELHYAVEDEGSGSGRLMRSSATGGGDTESVELAPNVKGLDFRFIKPDGEESADWDTARDGKLPATVEITLYLGREDDKEPVAFTTAVAIPLAWEREALGRGLAELAAEEKEKAKQKAKEKAKAGTTGGEKTGTGDQTPGPDTGDEGDEGNGDDEGDEE